MSLSSNFVLDSAGPVQVQVATFSVPTHGILHSLNVSAERDTSRISVIMTAAQVHQLHDVLDTWVRQNPLCSVEACSELATWACESCAGTNFCADHGIAGSDTGCVVCEATA